MGDPYALDFDGVLCDSYGESSRSAVKVFYLCGGGDPLNEENFVDCVKKFLVNPQTEGIMNVFKPATRLAALALEPAVKLYTLFHDILSPEV